MTWLRGTLWAAAWLLLPLILIHTGLLWGTDVLCGGDLVNYFIPMKEYWVRHGFLTGWYACSFGGRPFFGDIQQGVFYPPNWAFFLGISATRVYTLLAFVHLWAGGIGMFHLARRWLDRSPALMSALGWMCGGYVSLRLTSGVVVFIFALAWLPTVVGCVLDILAERRGAIPALAMTGALQFLAGAPQIVQITWLGAGVLVLVHTATSSREGKVRRLGHFLAAGVLVGLLVAPQVVASAEMGRLAQGRGDAAENYQYLSHDSLAPHMLLTWIAPEFFMPGNSEELFWGGDVGFVEVSAYLGIVPLLLALFAVLFFRTSPLPTDVRWWLLVVIPLGLIVALGRHNPAGVLLTRMIPGQSLFRVPARWIIWWYLGGSLAAGAGLQVLLGVLKDDPSAPGRRRALQRWLLACVPVLVLLALLMSFRWPILGVLGFEQTFGRAPGALRLEVAGRAASSLQFALVLVVAGGAIVAGALAGRLGLRPALGLLFGMVVLDLLRFWMPWRTPLPLDTPQELIPSQDIFHRVASSGFEQAFYPRTELVQRLSEESGRILALYDLQSFQVDQFQRELLMERPAHYGLQMLRGYQPLQLASFVRDFQPTDTRGLPPKIDAFGYFPRVDRREPLDRFNASLVLSYLPPEGLLGAGLEPRWRTATGLTAYANPHARGWAWLSTSPRWPGDDGVTTAGLKLLSRDPDREELEVTVGTGDGARHLHFAEVDYPGWHVEARQGGEVLRADGRSIDLQPGKWKVSRRYQPTGRSPLLLAVMLLGWLSCAAWLAWATATAERRPEGSRRSL